MKIQTANEFFIKDISFKFDLNLKDSFYLIHGENGSGKSSFLRLLQQNSKTYFKGKKVYLLDQKRLSPLGRHTLDDLLKKLKKFEYKQSPLFKDFYLRIKDYADIDITKLSGGQNQMVKICLMLFIGADYYFLDEPFQYLDKNNSVFLEQIIEKLTSENNFGLLVEHRKFDCNHRLNSLFVEKSLNHIEVCIG